MNESYVFYIDIGFTTRRPIVPDQMMSRVQITAFSEVEAHREALIMVASRPGVVMTTSSRTHRVEV